MNTIDNKTKMSWCQRCCQHRLTPCGKGMYCEAFVLVGRATLARLMELEKERSMPS
jgi:hypothetical protein